jgi:hypothetical protein
MLYISNAAPIISGIFTLMYGDDVFSFLNSAEVNVVEDFNGLKYVLQRF